MVSSNIPTDNLYKFMAIFGLLGYLALLLYPLKQKEHLNNEIHKLEEEIILFEHELELGNFRREQLVIEFREIDSSLNKYDSIISHSKMKRNSDFKYLKDKEYRDYLEFVFKYKDDIVPEFSDYQTLKEKEKESVRLYQDLILTIKMIGHKNEVLVTKLKTHRQLQNVLWGSEVLCVLLSISGFRLWYLRLQKFIDKEMNNNV